MTDQLTYIFPSAEGFSGDANVAYQSHMQNIVQQFQLDKISASQLMQILNDTHQLIKPNKVSSTYRRSIQAFGLHPYNDKKIHPDHLSEPVSDVLVRLYDLDIELGQFALQLCAAGFKQKAIQYEKYCVPFLDHASLIAIGLSVTSQNSIERFLSKKNGIIPLENFIKKRIILLKGEEYFRRLARNEPVEHDEEAHKVNLVTAFSIVLNHFSITHYEKWGQLALPVGYFCVHPSKIQGELTLLCNEIKSRVVKKCDPIETAAWAHGRYLYIHPHTDGNKRVARSLMNIILMSHGLKPILFSKDDQSSYINSCFAQMSHDLSTDDQKSLFPPKAFQEFLITKIGLSTPVSMTRSD